MITNMQSKHEKHVFGIWIRIFVPILTLFCAVLTIYIFMIVFSVRKTECDIRDLSGMTDVSGDISYIVKEYGGKIGVFIKGNTRPESILEIYVFTLPEGDAAKLKDGITVTGEDRMRSLIEDFTG